jgi:hypothetical protein
MSPNSSKQWKDTFTQLLALASRLEGEGQYNLAKLCRAAIESLNRRKAYQVDVPTDKAAIVSELEQTIDALSGLGLEQDFLAAFKQGVSAMSAGRLPLIDETPNAFVCRTCGHLALTQPEEKCPVCDAWSSTFIKFLPVYWLEAFEPFTAQEKLRQTPEEVARLLDGLPEEVLSWQPEGEGWAIRNIISHMRDAQGVLDYRLDLFLKDENPVLESKAVFEWATREEERPPSTMDIFDSYRSSRQDTLQKLESIPLSDWWRTGFHTEFGPLTLRQHASYFAAHEITHLPQIQKLREKLASVK